MHASEQARLLRASITMPAPGSLEEAEALQAIDNSRIAGEPCLSCAGSGCNGCGYTGKQLRTSDRRRRKHWSGRAAQLGRTW